VEARPAVANHTNRILVKVVVNVLAALGLAIRAAFALLFSSFGASSNSS